MSDKTIAGKKLNKTDFKVDQTGLKYPRYHSTTQRSTNKRSEVTQGIASGAAYIRLYIKQLSNT